MFYRQQPAVSSRSEYNPSMILSLSLLLSQESIESIPKMNAGRYREALKNYQKAFESLDSDPSESIRLLNEIILSSSIEKKECRLRIQNSDSTWGDARDFFPYLLRGQAHYRKAERMKNGDPKGAREECQAAIEDFEQSVKKKVRGSDAELNRAKQLLGSFGAGGGPLKEFEDAWFQLVDKKNFAEARRLIEGTKGGFLTAPQKKDFLDRTLDRCRTHVESGCDRFLRSLRAIDSLRSLRSPTPAAFERDFQLPDPGTLLEEAIPAEFRWGADLVPILRELREGKDALESLLAHSVRSVPIAKRGGQFHDWFACVEGLAFDIFERTLSAKSEQVRTATADRRRELRKDAEKLVERWKAFEGEVRQGAAGEGGAAFLARVPSRRPEKLLDQFPVEASGLAEIFGSILKSPEADDPERALEDLRRQLLKLRSENWERFLRDSQREILALLIAVEALRGFLVGKTPRAVAEEVRNLGTEYKSLGGRGEENRFGGKVRQVFEIFP